MPKRKSRAGNIQTALPRPRDQSGKASDKPPHQTMLLELLKLECRDWLIGVVNTKEAALLTGVPVNTLVTLRSIGGGPRFIKPTPRTVRYFRIDLFEWMLADGLKSNTAGDGIRLDLRTLLLEQGGSDD